MAFRTNIAYARYEEGMDCLEVRPGSSRCALSGIPVRLRWFSGSFRELHLWGFESVLSRPEDFEVRFKQFLRCFRAF